MKFKDEQRMKPEFWVLHPKLQLIVVDVMNWGLTRGEEPTFTCFLRTEQEQADLVAAGEAVNKVSVHQFGRGADFRMFTNHGLNLLIDDYVNEKYVYDPSRPDFKTLITHEGTALHHHLQVVE